MSHEMNHYLRVLRASVCYQAGWLCQGTKNGEGPFNVALDLYCPTLKYMYIYLAYHLFLFKSLCSHAALGHGETPMVPFKDSLLPSAPWALNVPPKGGKMGG